MRKELDSMKDKEIASLMTSTVDVQAEWLSIAFAKADLPLGVSPLELPPSFNALKYVIPNTDNPLWLAPTQHEDSQTTPRTGSRRHGVRTPLTGTTASQTVVTPRTPSTPIGRAMADFKKLPKAERQAFSRSERSKWIDESARKYRTATHAKSGLDTPLSPHDLGAVEVALKFARLPPNATTIMEAVMQANALLSPDELDVVIASAPASEAWRREVIRLWKLKHSVVDISPPSVNSAASRRGSVAGSSCERPAEAEASNRATLGSVAEPPSSSPFVDAPTKPPNAFLARLKGEKLPLEDWFSGQLLNRGSGVSSVSPSPRYMFGVENDDYDPESPSKPYSRPRAQSRKVLVPQAPAKAGQAPQLPDAPQALGKRYPARFSKPPSRELNFDWAAIDDALKLRVHANLANGLPEACDHPTTRQAWAEYVQAAVTHAALRKERYWAQLLQLQDEANDLRRQRYIHHAAVQGAHQWEHVAPLADANSQCEKYVSLLEEYPRWVAGEEAWVNFDRDISTLKTCQKCSALDKDKKLLAWLNVELTLRIYNDDVVVTAEDDAADLATHIEQMKASLEDHKCPGVVLDQLPEDGTTLLQYRIFYGLGETT